METRDPAKVKTWNESLSGPPHLGDYVYTGRYGYRGRVTQLHWHCPQDEAWLLAQTKPFSEDERDFEKWVTVLVNGGGAIVTCASDCEVLEPFDFGNRDRDVYFRPTDR